MDKEFDEIYRQYAGDVYHFLLGLSRSEAVSMDILQDTMLKAIEAIDSFQQNCSMKTWLCTIARNEYLNFCKRAENRNLPLDQACHTADADLLEHRFSDKMQAMEIHRVLHHLDEPYKENPACLCGTEVQRDRQSLRQVRKLGKSDVFQSQSKNHCAHAGTGGSL